jgi:glyceraldehyde 3-phosphate dehydrogenase
MFQKLACSRDQLTYYLKHIMTLRIAINGLGRIGRCVIRALYESGRNDIEIVALNGPAPIEQHLHLLKYDSVHGIFGATLAAEGNGIRINNHVIPLLGERDPLNLPWKELGVDMVLECTGKFNKRSEAAKHLQAGTKKVIVSAPCDGADSTIVYGVNQQALKADHDVISIGSCTTNCLAPVAKLINDHLGIVHGFMTTVHSFTGDQNLVDGSHKDMRRARSAPLSMVPTSTGAAKALGLVLPELIGKLDGSAVRVPTANVSMIDLSVVVKRDTTAEEINAFMTSATRQAPLRGVLEACNEPLVSTDFNHNPHSSIIDLRETHVVDKRLCRVVSWYDNEWGFSNRMLDIAALVGK